MFDVDHRGLAKLLERRGPAWGAAVVQELVQNALDTNAKNISVTISPVPNAAKVSLVVTDDDPDGFEDLRHAYTLFAESPKKAHAELRGRFDLGEKLVIAVCDFAQITTTTGRVIFEHGKRTKERTYRTSGTEFWGTLRMTRDQIAAMEATVERIIPSPHVTLTLNGEKLPARKPVTEFETTLETEVADESGVLRRRQRKTIVRVYEPIRGEEPTLYELGLPVVALDGDRFCYDVQQRVPVNMERDNVPPAYLRSLRVAAANALHDRITPTDANTWMRDALRDARVEPATVRAAVTARFGERVVAYDPSDKEANSRAAAEGYTVVHGAQLSGDEWENVRKVDGLLPAAGKVLPTPKPYPNGTRDEILIPRGEWTRGMQAVARYAELLSERVLGAKCDVRIAREPLVFWSANYGQGRLCLNFSKLGSHWFDTMIGACEIPTEIDELLIHEFGHHYEMDHLSDNYYRALCRIGARMRRTQEIASLVLREFAK